MALRRNLLAAGAAPTAGAGFVAARAGAHAKQADAPHAVMTGRPGTVTSLTEEADRGTR
ncbi:hypothetical protein OG596_17910 [Streptomyces sp. NBC_01102]|uniref:hypothetical protein n=1 Tax=unclassified Streptomyces TaxID=2593676 RepID=UPI00386B6D3C|nr:hypothetical protein OG596_17910 [Streptomyces sp. NBC_01102]